MTQLLFSVLAFAIIVSGIVGFARGFLRNFNDQQLAWQEYRPRFYRQLIAGFLASTLIGLVAPSVWVVILTAILASVCVGYFQR